MSPENLHTAEREAPKEQCGGESPSSKSVSRRLLENRKETLRSFPPEQSYHCGKITSGVQTDDLNQ
jgi:hypothetical protein